MFIELLKVKSHTHILWQIFHSFILGKCHYPRCMCYMSWYSFDDVFYVYYVFLTHNFRGHDAEGIHKFNSISSGIKGVNWVNWQRWTDKMWGVRVRPWCWEVAGPWTVAAWFTTPAVPPHRVNRWRSDGGSVFPLGSRKVVPSHCVPPMGYRVGAPSFLIFATSVTAVEREHAN